jgi:hypothetical protein
MLTKERFPATRIGIHNSPRSAGKRIGVAGEKKGDPAVVFVGVFKKESMTNTTAAFAVTRKEIT